MSKRSISTLGVLRQAVERGEVAHRTVQEEVRENLIQALRGGGALFPGIIGYDDTVVPQLVNALLSQHNFILLGLRGQAKTRLLRALVTLLDEEIPVMPGCEINDDPLAPICASCRARIAADGEATAIGWLHRDLRYVEKLATPDVTIADMVGDIDPIKAAKAGLQLSSELTRQPTCSDCSAGARTR
jgi:magnesium chelatase subunit I